MKDLIKEAKNHELAIERIKQMVADKINKRLMKVELPNVQKISSSPRIVIVKASTVFENNFNLSAEYYITETQAEALIRQINNKTTISAIRKLITEVVESGFIRLSSENKMFINSALKTELIEILKLFEEDENGQNN